MYGFAQSIMNSSSGKKFSSEDVKRIYFVRIMSTLSPSRESKHCLLTASHVTSQGNWLRDYSQVRTRPETNVICS